MLSCLVRQSDTCHGTVHQTLLSLVSGSKTGAVEQTLLKTTKCLGDNFQFFIVVIIIKF